MTPETKKQLLADPEQVFRDPEVFQALIEASHPARGNAKVVDMKAAMLARLQHQLDQAKATQSQIVNAAEEIYVSTTRVHHIVLRLLNAQNLAEFLDCLRHELMSQFDLDDVLLVFGQDHIETPEAPHPVLRQMNRAEVEGYCPDQSKDDVPKVIMRPIGTSLSPNAHSYAQQGSEAVLMLDIDPNVPTLVILSSQDSSHFAAEKASDLLHFLAGVIELELKHWLQSEAGM